MKINDLTKGPITKNLILLAMPLMIAKLLAMAYNLADMYWVGKLGTEELSAVGTAGMYFWLSASVCILATLGTEVSIAQCVGRDDRVKLHDFAQTGLKLSIYIAFIYSLILLVFAPQLIGFFNVENPVSEAMAITYLRYLSIGTFFSMVTAVCLSIFQGIGKTAVTSLYMGIGLVLNIVLDPVFIFIFDMGVAGVAIATSLSLFIIFLMFAVKLYKETNIFVYFNLFKINVRDAKRILTISTPNALQNIIFTFMAMVITVMVVVYGDAAIAGQKIGNNIESFSWMIGIGITTAVGIFVGQNFGGSDMTRVLKGYHRMFMMMFGYGLVVSIVMFFFNDELISIFSTDPEVIKIGGMYLIIISISQITVVLEAVSGGVFNGLGQTKTPAFFSITGNIIRVPLAFYLASFMGLNGIWLAISLSTIYRGLGTIIALEYELKIRKSYLKLLNK